MSVIYDLSLKIEAILIGGFVFESKRIFQMRETTCVLDLRPNFGFSFFVFLANVFV